jgi:hypothetical protein
MNKKQEKQSEENYSMQEGSSQKPETDGENYSDDFIQTPKGNKE